MLKVRVKFEVSMRYPNEDKQNTVDIESEALERGQGYG